MSVLFKRLIHLKKKLLDFEKHTFLRILVCSSNNIKLCGFVTSQDILFHGVHTIIGRYMTGNSAPPPPPLLHTLVCLLCFFFFRDVLWVLYLLSPFARELVLITYTTD